MFAEALSRLPQRPAPTTREEHFERQRRLTDQFRQDDVFILASPSHAVHSNDVEYPYRTSSDLIYLTGWTEPESVFVMRYKDNGWISSLFVQPKDTLKEIWEGRRPGVEGATSDFAVHEAYNNDELEAKMQEWLTDARRVFHRGASTQDLTVWSKSLCVAATVPASISAPVRSPLRIPPVIWPSSD